MPGKYWASIKAGAEKRKVQFDLNPEDAWETFKNQNGTCALSGVPIEFRTGGRHTASLDRIDSSKGYTRGNVQWVHKNVNQMKMDMPEPEFIELCKAIAAHKG